ncbi:hypothetical protein TMUPMC115_1992 [Tetragenococcus muriaticus PMC-11-5]|uniref:Uncharacterized protein n=1 Tax=Tetragenococcus muriaticus PMC-11-5 TaxID=1302649 RepID=A0A091C2I8_9ENTE|nr:hypothetical protein TMUPMC115_1992 [Tetragenococcus muriaticus PMC-11-5]
MLVFSTKINQKAAKKLPLEAMNGNKLLEDSVVKKPKVK